jgi:hypothetical protein
VLLGIIGAVLFFVCRGKNSKPRATAVSQPPANGDCGVVQLSPNYDIGQVGSGSDGDYGDGRLQM